MEVDFVLPQVVYLAFIIVAAAIIMDTVLGIIKAVVDPQQTFLVTKLPAFLASGILPYVGALGIVALGAHFIGEPYAALFYAAAAATLVKYLADIKNKLAAILSAKQ